MKTKYLVNKFTLKEWEIEKSKYTSEDYKIAIDGWNGFVYVYKII